MPVWDEVAVYGYRSDSRPDYTRYMFENWRLYQTPMGPGTGGGGTSPPPPVIQPTPPPSSTPPDTTFLPPIIPHVIEEIIVTAKAPVRPPFVSTAGMAGGALSTAAFWLTGGAMVIAAMMDRAGLRRMEESYSSWLTLTPPPDTPLRLLQPEVLPEVTVTAKREPFVLPQPFTFFSPDDDPWVMIPIWPRYVEPRPGVEVDTITLPEIRPLGLPLPTPVPLPFALPFALPMPYPLPYPAPQTYPLPLTDPQPLPLPLPVPLPVPIPVPTPFPTPIPIPTPVPTPIPIPIPTPTPTPFPQPDTMPEPDLTGNCPPCVQKKDKKDKKDEDEERQTCYKKLVREGRYADLDSSHLWNEIDCDTGRDIKHASNPKRNSNFS